MSPFQPDLLRRTLQALGPGLITACVVIGPGSILTASKVGAEYGFARGWVVVIAMVFMLNFMAMGARLGVVTQQSAGDLLRRRGATWLAWLIGWGTFFICATFQFGNNIGVHAALSEYLPARFAEYGVVLFNAASLTFLFGFRNLYRALERLMTVLVAVMLVAFAVNLLFARPNVVQLLQGLLPPWRPDQLAGLADLSLLGLVATTLSIPAAYYQSYLARWKGWRVAEIDQGLFDARVGSLIMGVITLMIMSTSASVLRGNALDSVSDVANQLQPLFGETGKLLFCLGLFAAAYSSFLVNSMVGGFVLADSLDLGGSQQDAWPRRITALILVIGMCVALWVIRSGATPVAAIVAAQAVTVVAAPLTAAALWWLTSSAAVMGKQTNSRFANLLAGLGFVLLLAMAAYTACYKVAPAVSSFIEAR